MGLGATLAEAATSGLAGAVTGGIGSIVSGGLGLLGGLFKRNNNGFKTQQKLMQQAWEYEIYRDWETEKIESVGQKSGIYRVINRCIS